MKQADYQRAVRGLARRIELARAVPVQHRRRGRFAEARVMVPAPRGRARAIVVRVPVADHVGWFGSSTVRKTTHAVTHPLDTAKSAVHAVTHPLDTAQTAYETARKVAHSKALQAVVKTSPIWLNLVPPPTGQALAAGAAAGLAALKVADAAAKGSVAAKRALEKARKIVANRKATHATVAAGAKLLRDRKMPPASAAKRLKRLADKRGNYRVITPSGRTFVFAASGLLR